MCGPRTWGTQNIVKAQIENLLAGDSVVTEQAAKIDDLAHVVGLVHGEEADHAADGSIKAG